MDTVSVEDMAGALRARLPGDFMISARGNVLLIFGVSTKVLFCLEDDEDELAPAEENLRQICIREGSDYAVARSRRDFEIALQHWGLG